MQDLNLLEIASELSKLNGTMQGAWLLGVCQATLAKEVGEIKIPSNDDLKKKTSVCDR